MTFPDHLFFFVLAVVEPIVSFVSYRRLVRRVAAGEKVDRANLYNVTVVIHWTLFAVAMAIWFAYGREWTALGFTLAVDGRFLAGALLTVIGIGFLVQQVHQARKMDQATVSTSMVEVGDLAIIIPRNGNELGRFYGLSITAGIVEEVLWRGYLIWYLSQIMPLWAAAVMSAIGFGLAHAYQGPANLPRITLVGGAFAGLYLLTGSIWLPIVLHAAVDILQGRAAYELVRKANYNEPDPTGNDLPAGSVS